jgi:hypothetical protein
MTETPALKALDNVLRHILLFDWDHPSVPTCTRYLASRAAAVKDEPLFAATATAARSVLDGREHGGMACACRGRARIVPFRFFDFRFLFSCNFFSIEHSC